MKFFGFLSVALALSVTGASASTVTLSQSYPGSIFGVNGGHETVTNLTSPITSAAEAGGFRVKTNAGEQLVLWCLDVAHYLFPLGTYATTDDPFLSSVVLSDQKIEDIEKLFEVNYSNPLLLTSNALSAGFQMALWEIVYEKTGDAYDLTTGLFKATGSSGPTGAAQAAADFLASLVNGVATQAYKLTFYESTQGRQNLVGVNVVPLPAAALLLGSGLVGLFAVGRRKRKIATT